MSRIERVVSGAEVAVAAGLGENAATIKEPGHPIKQAVPDGRGDTNVCAAYVADGGKAAVEA